MTTPETREAHEISGLDMKQTLAWYKNSGIELPPLPSDEDFPCPIENEESVELSSQELGALFSLFPENARKRSILRKVVGQPTTWFHKDSTPEKPTPTTEPTEALSPTAIVPSFIDYSPWGELKVPTADVWLYKLPDNIPENVKKIILAEGFIHEIGHSITTPAIYGKDYKLKFPDGRIVDGMDAILEFAELAEKHPPISHYASTYRGPENKFESDKPDYDAMTAINEEISETVAAHLLGFSYCGFDARGKDPFADRPEIKKFIDSFLNAELVVGE